MTTKCKINCSLFLKRSALAIAITGIFSGSLPAQDKPKTGGKSEATILMSYSKSADGHKMAMATVKAKKDGKFSAAKNAWVNFYVLSGGQPQKLRQVVTNDRGVAKVELGKDTPLDDSLYFTVIAKIEGDAQYEDAQEQMHYKEANVTLGMNAQDTSRTVVAKVTEMGKDGKESPVKNAEVKFCVKRLFGAMSAAEEAAVSTDDKGEATFAYPKNIPGDTAGNITVVAKILDNDKFGNVVAEASANWGTHLANIKDPFPRELWSPYAPWPLVITITSLFGGVWCVYFFLFRQMVKIKKDGKEVAKAETIKN